MAAGNKNKGAAGSTAARLDEAAMIGSLVHDFCWHYAPSHLTGSEHTLRGYRTALELYLTYLESVGVTSENLSADDLCRKRIEGWLEWLADERGNSPQTCNARLSSLRAFCKYASGHEVTLAHVYAEAKSVPNRKAPKTKVKSLTREAVLALTSAPDASEAQGRRDRALLSALYATACRISELLGLRVRDLHLGADEPFVAVTCKGGSAREVFVPERAAEHVRRHVEETLGPDPSPDAFVFWSRERGEAGDGPLTPGAVTKMMQRHAREVHGNCPDLPTDVTPHRLRHARATHWLDEGLSVAQVSKLLGHSNIQTTMDYLDISVDAKAKAMSHVPGVPEEQREPLWKRQGAMSLLELCGFKRRQG